MKTKSLIIANAMSNLEDFVKDGTIQLNSFMFNKKTLKVSMNIEDELVENGIQKMLTNTKGVGTHILISRSNERISTVADGISAFITSFNPNNVPTNAIDIYDSLRRNPSLYVYENFIQYDNSPIKDKLRECREYPYLMVVNNDVYKLSKDLYKGMSYYSLKDNSKEVVNKIASNLHSAEIIKLDPEDFTAKYFSDSSFATEVVKKYYDILESNL